MSSAVLFSNVIMWGLILALVCYAAWKVGGKIGEYIKNKKQPPQKPPLEPPV